MKDEKERSYDDMINLPRPVSKKHPRMPLLDRAAQFSPFSALSGYDDAIKETERLAEDKIEKSQSDFLSEDMD